MAQCLLNMFIKYTCYCLDATYSYCTICIVYDSKLLSINVKELQGLFSLLLNTIFLIDVTYII